MTYMDPKVVRDAFAPDENGKSYGWLIPAMFVATLIFAWAVGGDHEQECPDSGRAADSSACPVPDRSEEQSR